MTKNLQLTIKKLGGVYALDPDVGIRLESPSELISFIYRNMVDALNYNEEALRALEGGKPVSIEINAIGEFHARVSLPKVPWTCSRCKGVNNNPSNAPACWYCAAPYQA